jgi:hypothetical protein
MCLCFSQIQDFREDMSNIENRGSLFRPCPQGGGCFPPARRRGPKRRIAARERDSRADSGEAIPFRARYEYHVMINVSKSIGKSYNVSFKC